MVIVQATKNALQALQSYGQSVWLDYIRRSSITSGELQRSIDQNGVQGVTFSPGFLHSTGQAYKGASNSGVFLQITCDDALDIPVPQQHYTFGVVKAAQARGDFQVLAERDRRALRIHLGNAAARAAHRLRSTV